MNRPSSILTLVAIALFAFAAGFSLGAHGVANRIDAFRDADDASVPVVMAWIGANQSTAYGWQISSLGLIASASAVFAKMRCETTSGVRWMRLFVFTTIATVLAIGAMFAYVYWRLSQGALNS